MLCAQFGKGRPAGTVRVRAVLAARQRKMRHPTPFRRQQGRFRVSPFLALGLFILTGAALYIMARYAGQLQPLVSSPATPETTAGGRRYLVGQAGPFAIVQIYADGFDKLTPRERLLAYHLA